MENNDTFVFEFDRIVEQILSEKVDKDRMKCNSPRRTSGGSKNYVVNH